MPAILMIDDDKDFCGLVFEHFSRLGYTVTLAHNGADGLKLAASARPELILLDVMMPDMNGIEVLRELAGNDETGTIPVFILSAKYFDQGIPDLFTQERNFKDFVPKPVALGRLQQKMEAVLKK
ncbi:MAG: response regulator [Elusimicrobia bacterium]|jgi:CheY-like chemotaxis protein|nr:response regulator [Elusimicrobiota bacterium]